MIPHSPGRTPGYVLVAPSGGIRQDVLSYHLVPRILLPFARNHMDVTLQTTL